MRIGAAILSFIVGAIIGYGLSIASYVGYIELSGTYDREGAMAMGVAFVIGPAVAIVCGIAAVIWSVRRRRVPKSIA